MYLFACVYYVTYPGSCNDLIDGLYYHRTCVFKKDKKLHFLFGKKKVTEYFYVLF